MLTVISEDSVTPVEVVDAEKTVVEAGVKIEVAEDVAASLSGIGTLLRNFGEILNAFRFGVLAEGQEARVENKAGGVIESDYVGIAGALGNSSIANDGSVIGDYAAVAIGVSYDATVNNRGDLTGGFNGVVVDQGTISTKLNNYADITATEAGSIGVSVKDGAFATRILNIGQVLAGSFGIKNAGAASSIHNKGLINAEIGVETLADARVLNEGDITGSIASLVVSDGPFGAVVTNRGTMTGDLLFNDAADQLNNAGAINGDVFLKDGADKLNNTGIISGLVDLGDGNDRYNGTTALAAITVEGGEGRDDLRGSAADDTLSGGADRDVIRGGAGSDQISGGAGRDVLIGGADADTFILNAATESTEDFDVITDFVSGEDTLDLSALFAGTLAFSTEGLVGGGIASVHADEKANTNNFIEIDIDGNGFRDMLVLLQRAGTVIADDFIL